MASEKVVQAMETDVRQQLEEALWEAAVVIKVRNKDLLKWPDDVEALHQHRISLRVARSLVKFLKPYMKNTQNRELKDALKHLQDPTSRIRELDVLVPRVENPELRALCEQAQAETRAAFIAGLKASETQEALTGVQDDLRHIQWNRTACKKGIVQGELAQRLEAQRLACEEALAAMNFDDQEAVHDLRKKAKALRYVSRELKPCLPPETAQVGTRMRKVQDKLGEWCDARVNATLVQAICGDAGTELAGRFTTQAQAIMQGLKESQ